MGIYLEKYSFYKSPLQGREIHQLVVSEKDRLDQERPDTLKRYADDIVSMRSIARIALSKEVMAFIVRDDKLDRAIGIATVIMNQAVVHPEIGEIQGNNLDYWIKESCEESIHNAVGIELEDTGKLLKPVLFVNEIGAPVNRKKFKKSNPIFAVVQIDDLNPPIGLMGNSAQMKGHSLVSRGEPAILTPPEGRIDTYDVAGSGRISQIYYAASGYVLE